MTDFDKEFERLVADLDCTSPVDPYSVEPVGLSRGQLLESLHDFLSGIHELLFESLFESEWDSLVGRYTEGIESHFGVSRGEELQIQGARSYLVGPAFGLLDDTDTKIFGKFSGFTVDEWYDVPKYEDEVDINAFRRGSGLLIVLDAAEVEYIDGLRESVGCVDVPLGHGSPEIYQVIRQG